MSLLADFRVINDPPHRLEVGEYVTFKVEIPLTLEHSAGGAASYVMVKYGLEGATALKWELYLNGRMLLWTTSSGSNIATTLEAFEPNQLLPGENEFSFKVVSGTGAVRIADAVVHFHVNV